MKIQMLGVAAVATLFLVACTPDSDAAPTTPAAPAASPTQPAPAASSPILLGTDGLKVSGQALALGSPKAAAVAAITAALGQPSDTGRYEECGSGATDYANWSNGLTLVFNNDSMTGWQVSKAGLNTPEGVHVGSTDAEVKAAYPDSERQETTVGYVFIQGDMYGNMSEGQTQVERLAMGDNCDAT